MMYEDKTLTCQDCGQEFTFTADDQQYHAEKGYSNEPKRCMTCRQTRRQGQGGSGGGYSSYGGGSSRREMHPATCAQCGKQTQVPFEPRNGRPVYCSDCFSKQSTSGGGGGRSSRRY